MQRRTLATIADQIVLFTLKDLFDTLNPPECIVEPPLSICSWTVHLKHQVLITQADLALSQVFSRHWQNAPTVRYAILCLNSSQVNWVWQSGDLSVVVDVRN